jgi:hypothetical protein
MCDPKIDWDRADEIARAELVEEELRKRVDLAKERIRAQMGKPWWKRLFPYTITFTRN